MRCERIEDAALYLGDCCEFESPQDIKMVFTDPPYGMSYGSGWSRDTKDSLPGGKSIKRFGGIKGDDLRGDALRALVRDALAKVPKDVEGYVCFPWRSLRNHRRFVGCEIDPKYFDVACRRVEESIKRSGFDFGEDLNA